MEVTANGKKLVMHVDTGAAVTIISEGTYRALWPQQGPPITPTITSLNTYTGEPIQVKGGISLEVQHNGQSKVLPALVVRGSGPTLLGRDWMQELRLDWHKIFHINHSPELAALLHKYKSVFQKELGAMKGMKVKIYAKPEVKPVFRRTPPSIHAETSSRERAEEAARRGGHRASEILGVGSTNCAHHQGRWPSANLRGLPINSQPGS